jgi:hypothetical protein
VELLTVAEIAKRLRLPESTVRYYRNRFNAYVPSVGSGRAKINLQTGHDSYEAWRERDHDDLVLAVALACYWKHNRGQSEWLDPLPGVAVTR